MSNMTIKNVSSSQDEILEKIILLHNEGKPFQCDMTYSKGMFYKHIPKPEFKFDVDPVTEDCVKIDPWGKLPLDDNRIESIVIDLPFIVASKKCASMTTEVKDGSNIIQKRFSSYYPKQELFDSYKHWINEAYRVLKENGIMVFKCQNTISGGKFLSTECWSWNFATEAGFDTLDRFTLCAKSRLISGKIKKQQHARNYTSTFWVFKKVRNRKWKNEELNVSST